MSASQLRLPLTVSDDYESSPEQSQHDSMVLSPRSPRVYLPPYLFHKHELQENIYRSNDEAYMSIAKALLHDYTSCGHSINPSQIISRHLLPTQRKQFADAHMEQAVSISSYPEKGETPKTSIMRRIDNVFGECLLEYFASKDGNLKYDGSTYPSVSSPFSTTPKSKVKHSNFENGSVDDNRLIRACGKHDEENNKNAANLSSKARLPILPTWSSQKEQNQEFLKAAENKEVSYEHLSSSEENPLKREFESTFDRLFHADTDESLDGEKKDKVQRKRSDSAEEDLDENSETFIKHSSSFVCGETESERIIIRNGTKEDSQKELLAEMLKANDIMNKTIQKKERDAHDARLDILMKEFNSFSNHSENFVQHQKPESRDEVEEGQREIINLDNDSEYQGSNAKIVPNMNASTIFRSKEMYKPPNLSPGMVVNGDIENRGKVNFDDREGRKDHFVERSNFYSRSMDSQDSEDENRCVSIVAPSCMQGNSTFEAKYRGTSFLARVVSTFIIPSTTRN